MHRLPGLSINAANVLQNDDENADNQSDEEFVGFENDENSSSFARATADEMDAAAQQHERAPLKHPPEAACEQEYREDSEGVVEAIEVDDEQDIEESDGHFILRNIWKTKPDKLKNRKSDFHIQTKRKRKKSNGDDIANTAFLNSQPLTSNEVFEVNSDSTTKSLKQKRQQLNSKYQLNVNHKHNQRTTQKANAAGGNKCSTESTSEFPVSSPSNPQQPHGGGIAAGRGAGGVGIGGGGEGVSKYPHRPSFLKNTLPADSFERQLALITACNPQMTLSEKIQSWYCEDEFSDVEDVKYFDEDFKIMEEQRKRFLIRQKNRKGGRADKEYDFLLFRLMVIPNMFNQQHQQLLQQDHKNVLGSIGGGGGDNEPLNLDSTGSDSSKIRKTHEDRPSTSALAQQQMQQRRTKALHLNSAMMELKKRQEAKKISKSRNQNSTTPPATSSSENERDCFRNPTTASSKARTPFAASSPAHMREKLICPSSSEEANSQDVPAAKKPLPSNSPRPRGRPRLNRGVEIVKSQSPDKIKSKNLHCLAGEKIDSVFRLHRLNPEIDKKPLATTTVPSSKAEEPKDRLIQIHMKAEEKIAPNLFKTPTVPPKYLASNLVTSDSMDSLVSVMPADQSNSKPTNHVDDGKIYEEEIKQQSEASKQQITDEDTTPLVTSENSETPSKLDGVYHKQHEFCNYLGLTGMSTATAMANAVAELAQCNLTRRSMRVLRQQQQERKDKTNKEKKPLKTAKSKRAKKRDINGYGRLLDGNEDRGASLGASTNSLTSDVTHSTPSLRETQKPGASTNDRVSAVVNTEEEPQIKILYHVASKEEPKTDAGIPTVREIIQRTAKLSGCKNFMDFSNQEISNSKTTELGSINSEHDPEYPLQDAKLEKLNSPRARERDIINHRFMNEQRRGNSSSEERRRRSNTSEDGKTFTPKKLKESAFFLPHHTILASSPIRNGECLAKELNISIGHEEDNNSDKLLTPESRQIKEKLQAALEESRKSKPSIFIVQSLECIKDVGGKDSIDLQNPSQNKMISRSSNTSEAGDTTFNGPAASIHTTPKRRGRKPLNKARKSNKRTTMHLRNASMRQLRSHRLFGVKSKKVDRNPNESQKKDSKHLKAATKTAKKQKLMKTVFKLKRVSNKATDQELDSSSYRAHAKSFRNAQTETRDFEVFGGHSMTRLMAKASSLLKRSRRISMSRNASTAKSLKSLLKDKLRESTSPKSVQTISEKEEESIIVEETPTKAEAAKKEFKSSATSTTPPLPPPELSETKNVNVSPVKVETTTRPTQAATYVSEPLYLQQDSDNVVVSSTTNCFDDRIDFNLNKSPSSPTVVRSLHSSSPTGIATTPLETKDCWTQSDNERQQVRYLHSPARMTQVMRNPLKAENGEVLYIYYEMDVLIVIQELLVSFWKCSRVLNVLSVATLAQQQAKPMSADEICEDTLKGGQSLCDSIVESVQPSSSSLDAQHHINNEWILLGELKRLANDTEVSAPYSNRICLHNSTPIYVELRARQLPKNFRDCNLISMYINIYFYNEDDMVAKTSSIQLDTIQSDIPLVNYTTLRDSRYFIITWPQENLLGKTRSGLCKYSLTPQLDTLASIREFKQMRHIIRYLDCLSHGKLIGFGDSEITIWDHRSGDVLMNYDLEMPLGRNLGSVYYPSQELDQHSLIVLFQWRQGQANEAPELLTIACNMAHIQPSHRLLQRITLPATFQNIERAINTSDHMIITAGAESDEEIWISYTNPSLVALVAPQKSMATKCRRYYSREKNHLIELNEKMLSLDTLANHNLKLATGMA